MKRYLIAAAVFALLATACSGGAEVAATVNGVDIDKSTVAGLIASETELTDTQFREALTAIVQWAAIADAARTEFGVDPSDSEVLEFSDGLIADTGLSREDYLSQQQVSEEGFLLYAEQLLIGEQVIAAMQDQVGEVSLEEAQQMITDDPKAWTIVCASHILVATEDEANAVLERLAAGEDFATLAIELSLDTGSGASGGDLGCTVPSDYVDPFADATLAAELGTVTDPVETQFGFHLIQVNTRDEASVEDVQQAIADTDVSNMVSDWYLASVTEAEITVDDAYGTWETDPIPTIVAPVS